MLLEQHGLVRGADMLEEIAQTLRPKDRSSSGSLAEAFRVHVLTALAENARHPVHPAGTISKSVTTIPTTPRL